MHAEELGQQMNAEQPTVQKKAEYTSEQMNAE